MDKLLIVGAGNVGGFVAYNVHDFGPYQVLGFLDDDVKKAGKKMYGYSVLGTVADIAHFSANEKLHVAIGISSPKVRSNIADAFGPFEFVYPNLIAPNVWMSAKVSMGHGSIIYPGVNVNYESVIGDFVIMNMNCAIGHNCRIDSFSTLAPGVNLAGFTHLQRGVNVGIGVCTRQNAIIGKYSVIGGQAMVLDDVDANAIVAGVPAKKIR